MYYIGLDVHKKTISYCIKLGGGEVHTQGVVNATRGVLDGWLKTLPQPWSAAMEATLFTGWIYDHLKPHAASLKVAHPLMLRAIAASKKKNDRVDAGKIADLLRCNLLPECYMAPVETRERRRTLRYRNLLVRQAVQMKNKLAGLLMETGVTYNKKKLHQKRYFAQFLKESEELPEALKPLLKVGRDTVERVGASEKALLRALERDPVLAARVERLSSIPGVGPVTALTWALEVGEVSRFASVKHAVSYCGLCSAENSSAGIQKRSPISKQRNKHLQTVLVEAAKLAPRWNADLALLYDKETQRGNANRATLAVARKLVAYLLAVDRREKPFQGGKKEKALRTKAAA
jgi:transposase